MLFKTEEQKKLYIEIMNVKNGYFSDFKYIQSNLQAYCTDNRTFALEYWYLNQVLMLCCKWLKKKSSDAQKKKLVDELIPLLTSEVGCIKLKTIEYLDRKASSLNKTNKNFSNTVLGAYTVNIIVRIYNDDLETCALEKKEVEILKKFIGNGSISLPDKTRQFKERLNYLISTGHNRRGEGSTASESIGGSAGLSIGFDFGKAITPIGLEASGTLNVTGKIVSEKIIAVERQNDQREDWEMRAYCLMGMLGWSGSLELGAVVKVEVGSNISTEDIGMDVEFASIGIGATIEAKSGGKINGVYLMVDDPKPTYYMGIAEIEEPLYILVNSMPQKPAVTSPSDTFIQLWSHAYEASAGAGYEQGAKAEFDPVPTELFIGSKGNIEAKANAKISNYRFQTITSPPTTLIKTQDTRVVLKQVGVSASLMTGVTCTHGKLTLGNQPKEGSYMFINTVSSETAIAVWNKNENQNTNEYQKRTLKPGTGYIVSLSVSMKNLTKYYIDDNQDYLNAVSKALGVDQKQLEECISNDQFRDVFAEISTRAMYPGAMFFEASFAYDGSDQVVLLDSNGYVKNTFRQSLKDSTQKSSNLESIRLCYRREDNMDNSYTRFKLGFNVGLKFSIELGKIEKAGTSEMINVYQHWYTAEKKNNEAIVHPKLFL